MKGSMFLEQDIDKVLEDLFPINRSLTGDGTLETIEYIQKNILENSTKKSIPSGSKAFDWTVPDEWNVYDAYVKNKHGEKIIDLSDSNIHLMSYSVPFSGVLEKEELLKHLHTLPDFPEWIPYRTSYYTKNWGFCCAHTLLSSDKFEGPFEVKIDSNHNPHGHMHWLEAYKKGTSDQEILISSYFCHPSLANDNLSGFVTAAFLFKYLQTQETRFSYRLALIPETIGAISFLANSNVENIIGGMVLSCVGGPDKFSIKEGFDSNHWINQAAHLALNEYTNNDYITYPFIPDGSDERQYSSPEFRIVTPSIHKSKYYEYDQYHTSADNLDFISSKSIKATLDLYCMWINNIESYSLPKRKSMACEYQLGGRGLYPSVGGAMKQGAHQENQGGSENRLFNFDTQIEVKGEHLDQFRWLMHLADGDHSNFDIAKKSQMDLKVVNESIALFYQKGLIELA